MRSSLEMTIITAALAATAWGSACATGTYMSYASLPVGGCTVGDEAFSNFSALTFVNSQQVPDILETNIMVTPMVSGTVDELIFTYVNLPTTGNSSGNPSSSVVGVGNNQIFDYNFTYTLTPDPNPVLDVQMMSTILNTNAASVSAVKDVNNGGAPIFESSANNGTSSFTSLTSVSGPVTPVTDSGPFTVQDTISLQGQNGIAQQENFTNLFTEGPFTTTTPEPSSMFLIASGLMCFGLIRRRRAGR